MAYAYVGSATPYSNPSSGVGTVSYAPTVGNTLLVAAYLNGPGTGYTLQDGSNTYGYLGESASGYLALWSAHVATGGSLTLGFGGANGVYGLQVWEYSGLATSAYISGSFQSQVQAGPGVGANAITTSSNPNATSAPAMVWGISVNSNAFVGGSGDAGPALGTSSSFNSRTVGWIGTTLQAALAEDIRVTATGTKAITFGSVSGNQFDTFDTVAAAFVEASTGISIAWIT
jgi:hypothetical protein